MNNQNIDLDSTIREIKKDFFSFRNGMVAESLKNLYSKNKIIFGLTVPQFMELSKKYPKDLKLGLKLWDDNTSRESRLFALYIIPHSELSYESASDMILSVESFEEGEFLAFRLLRFLPFSKELLDDLTNRDIKDVNHSHCIEMFRKNLSIQSV